MCYAWLQRVLGVNYSFPTTLQISQECLDMMSKIFVGNPAYRISIAGIKSHPWFTQNLPDEVKVYTWLNSNSCLSYSTTLLLCLCIQQC